MTKISGLLGPGVTEPGLDRHPARRERTAHGGPEVERALVAVPALAGQPHGQLARQRLQHALEHRQLLPGGMHHVDVLGQRLAHRARQGLGPPVLDQPAP